MTTDVIPASHEDLLEAPAIGVLSSIGPDREPQAHPIWYDWDGGELRVSTTTDRQKYRNVQRDKRVTMTILDPDNPYRYLEVRGEVVETEEDPDKRFIDHLAKRYLGKDEYPDKQADAERVIIHIAPRHAATMG